MWLSDPYRTEEQKTISDLLPLTLPRHLNHYLSDIQEPYLTMACLTRLPHEILHNVFAEVDPVDLAALSSTCRAFYGFILKNRCLFKELYLKTFVRQ